MIIPGRDREHMADLRYIRPNELRLRANRVRAFVIILGLPSALALGLIHPLLTLAAGGAFFAIWDKQYRLLKGAEGEDFALGASNVKPGSLSTLPDDYIIFNQLRIPWRDTTVELDYVVVGPNDVFNVECKHLVGEIVGGDVEQKWIQHKRGLGNVPLSRETRNPVIQVRRSTHALASYLRAKQIDVWVQAVVVFTHPAARLSVASNSVPILTLSQLAHHIASFRPRAPFRQQGVVMRALKLLRDNKSNSTKLATTDLGTVLRSGRPRHISYFMRDVVPERVEAFMRHEVRSVMRAQQRSSQAVAAAQTPTPAPVATIQRVPAPRPRLTVMTRSVEKRRHRTVRTYEREEVTEVEETNETDFGRD